MLIKDYERFPKGSIYEKISEETFLGRKTHLLRCMTDGNYKIRVTDQELQNEFKLLIQQGQYYVRDTLESEKYIMLVLPRPETLPDSMYRTETMGIHRENQMWVFDWLVEYFDRAATEDEINLFKEQRTKYGDALPSYGEAVVVSIKLK